MITAKSKDLPIIAAVAAEWFREQEHRFYNSDADVEECIKARGKAECWRLFTLKPTGEKA